MRAAIFAAIDIWKHRKDWKNLQDGKMQEQKPLDEDKPRNGKPQIA